MSRFFTSLLCVCFLIPAIHSCKKGLPAEVAEEHGLMDQAIAALESDYKSTKKLEEKKEIAAKLGELYAKINNYSKADIYFKIATRDGATDPETHHQYAQVLKARERYEDALEQLREYEKAVPGSAFVAKEIELCESALEWEENPVQTIYRVEEVRGLNTGKAHDFAPVITAEGVVFTSNRSGGDNDATGPDESVVRIGQARPDLFIARTQRGKKKNLLQSPVLLESEGLINTEMSEGTAAFANKGKLMIYTSCNRPYETDGLKRNDSNCVLMSTTRKGKTWGETKRLPFCTDSGMVIHYGQPSLSEDGQKLYFSSNMEGGYGGYDIWVCTYVKRSKTWSDPINLGPVINSAKDEMYPHIYGEFLYFSSNGHPGVGGLDIFESEGRGNEWTEPYNLLPPINSGADDFSIFFERDKKKTRRSGNYGYMASNRGGNTAGTDNIYAFTTEPLVFTVEGYVYDSKTKEPIGDAKVTLSNFSDTSKVFVKTNDLGYYFMQLDAGTDYDLRAYKERYENPYENPTVSTVGYRVSKSFERDMYLDPFRVEFELDILYDLDSFVIRPDAAKLLDSFALTLKEHYYTQMELSSHTDSRGSDDYNRRLAQKRAESAVNYLISKGIEKERLVPKGYGEDKPKTIRVDDNNVPMKKDENGEYVINYTEPAEGEDPTGVEVVLTEKYINKFASNEDLFSALHQLNRRTEIRILSWEYEPKNAVEEEAEEYDPSVFEEEPEEEGEEETEEEEEGGGL